jgi:high affinity sulfate transporter 1
MHRGAPGAPGRPPPQVPEPSRALMALLRRIPGVGALAGYQASWLRRDIVAGLVLTTLLVPQGMAYAELAGLPAITGLYTSVLCLIGYAMCGPSRILVLGPDSSLGPMIAATILPIMGSGGSPERAIELASMLALMVGAIMIVAGVAKLGFVADLLSKPTQIGYMNGLALTILVGQLPKLCGFSVSGDNLIDEARGFVNGLSAGDAVGAAVAVGALTLALILALGRWLPRMPAVLLAVVAAIAASAAFSLSDHGVSVVGTLPQGFPPLTLPGPASDLPLLLAGALGIVLVALADTISTASSFAARTGQEVNGSGEMVGIGAANVAASFFQGFPVSTSGSRTAVAEQAGAKTQVTGLVGAAAIVLMLVLVPGLLKNLPNPALAAVVIAASLSLADVAGTARLWRQRKEDFVLCVVAFLGVALVGVLGGIAIAVGLSILSVFRRVWWPYQTTLGRVPGMPGAHDRTLHPEAQELPGLVIFRFDAPLCFANTRTFREQIRALAVADPRPRWIVIAAEPITDVDTTAADMLEDLDEELNAAGTSLVFAELKDPVRAKLERYELIGPLDPAHFFPTVESALEAFRRQTGAEWTDPGPPEEASSLPDDAEGSPVAHGV